MRKCGIEIESLSAHRVVDKLARAGIEVLGAEKIQKNAVTVWVNGKDRKKVFAILRGSCYNIKKVTYRGIFRASVRQRYRFCAAQAVRACRRLRSYRKTVTCIRIVTTV